VTGRGPIVLWFAGRFRYDRSCDRSYGSWPSPTSAAGVARAHLRLSYPTIHGDQVWQETRPDGGGRTTIVRSGVELLPAPWNARTRVHEYGGRSYLPLASAPGQALPPPSA
jgi:hypothetical protein